MVKAGDASVEFHADTSPVAPEAERGIRRAAEQVEDDLQVTGKDFGDTLSKSMSKEIESHGPEFTKSIERGLKKRKIKADVDFDKDSNIGERFVRRTVDDIEGAFDKAKGPGGPFNRIGAAIADAIGSGFNVSGKSPLIAFLVPLVGAIIGLVVAALQAVNGLIAALATLPALIAAIGLQVGVVMIAFEGIGKAVQGAFAAKNAKELKEAIKDLTPSAQRFVKELLPLKGFFADLRKSIQEGFFASLGSIIPPLLAALRGPLLGGMTELAKALGDLFRQIALFFASPTFVAFLNTVIPATIDFLKTFGPNFIKFLDGIVQFSTAILPFLGKLGDMLGGTLFQLGDFFQRIVRNGSLTKWLDSMQTTLELVLELFGTLVEFVTVLLSQLDNAGGAAVIQALVDAIGLLSFFLATDVGKKALEGLIDFSIIAIKVTTGLILAIFLVLAALEALGEWIKNTAGPAIGDFFVWLGGKIGWLFFVVGDAMMDFFEMVGGAILDTVHAIGQFFTDLWHGITDSLGRLIQAAKTFKDRFLDTFANIGSFLFNAGRNLIQGLINGIRSMIPNVSGVMSGIAQTVRDFWPFSPAKVGPLSGSGDPMIAGQKTIQRFAEGIHMEIPEIRSAASEATSNIVFGRDAIRITFEGALPTQQQAEQTGTAVGAGINGQLAARNTRLAVRTL